MPRRARRYGGRRLISRPWKATFPDRRGRRPMMLSMVVVFPAPLRPTRHTDSPLPTFSETRRRISAGPRQVSIASTSSMGGPDQRGRHCLVAADLVRRARGEDRTLVHRPDTIRGPEDHVHVVLDDHGGDLGRANDRGDHLHDPRLLARADAAGRLV